MDVGSAHSSAYRKALAIAAIVLTASALGIFASPASAQGEYDWWHGTIQTDVVTTESSATYRNDERSSSTVALVTDGGDDLTNGFGFGSVEGQIVYPQAAVCGQQQMSEISGSGSLSDIVYRVRFSGTNWQIQGVGGSNLIPVTNTLTFVNPPGCGYPPSVTQGTFNLPLGLVTRTGIATAERLTGTVRTISYTPAGQRTQTVTINLSRRYDTDCDGTPDLQELILDTPIDTPSQCTQLNPVEPSPSPEIDETLAEDWKQGWDQAEDWYDAAEVMALIAASKNPAAAAALAKNPVVVAAGAGWTIGNVVGGRIADALGDDPPDPNFTTVATPAFPDFDAVEFPKRKGADAERALEKLTGNWERMYGFGTAVLRCIERAQGAALVKNQEWRLKQRACAAENATKLADTFRKQRKLARTARKSLEELDVPNIKARKLEINRLRRKLESGELPGPLKRGVRQLKLSDAELQDLVERLVSVEKPPRLLDSIYSADVRKALKGAEATALGTASQYSSP